jgi:branched-chain amino acid transport system substrate-binding protein
MLYPKRLGVDRRRFLATSAIGLTAASLAARPKVSFAQAKTVKVGFLAPLTGEVAAWGLPGL